MILQELSDADFTAKLRGIQRSRWRMEFQRTYVSDTNMPRYNQWIETGEIDWSYHEPWMEYIGALRASGKDVKRIKVVDQPLNDYWRFAWAQTGRLNAAGDTTQWADRKSLAPLMLPPTDFYILDDNELMFLHFDGQLQPCGYSSLTTPEIVTAAITAFHRAWDLATAHDDFIPSH